MSRSALSALNLNSLVALDALLSECNVTRAARRVGITQPAMSQTLARLRELFDDPILVRSGRGMKRSPRADARANSARRSPCGLRRLASTP